MIFSTRRRPGMHIGWLCNLLLLGMVTKIWANEDVAVIDDPNDPCSTHALNAYVACVRDNPCVCKNCQADPSDPDWVIEATEPNSCQDISRIFCPLVRCCSPCEPALSFYHKCLAEKIASLYMGEDHQCQLFICVNEHEDFEGTCSLTDNPSLPDNTDTNPCETETTNYLNCVNGNGSCSSCNSVPTTDLTTLHLDSNMRTCQDIHNDLLCPLEQCCPTCSAQLSVLSTCVESKIVATDDASCSTTNNCADTTSPPTPSPDLERDVVNGNRTGGTPGLGANANVSTSRAFQSHLGLLVGVLAMVVSWWAL